MHVLSISPNVDSCAALIVKKSLKAYANLSEENKRFIDVEDLMQEGMIEAWKADQRFDPTQKTKYCTYLWRGLDLQFSKLNSPLKRTKRISQGIVEIDAPIASDSSTTLDFPDTDCTPEELHGAVSVLLGIFNDAGPQVQRLLVKLATGDWFLHGRKGMRLAKQLKYYADVFRASERDFHLLSSNRDVKAQVLDGMSKLTNIDVADARLLECGVCRGKFSLSDVQAGRYFASSLVCSNCLGQMQKKDPVETCFGKKQVVHKNGTTLTEGFSKTNAACRLHCPDRVACKHYVERGKRMTAAEAAVAEVEDLDDVEGIDDVEVPAKVVKAKGKTKTASKGKTAKSAKSTKPGKSTKAAKTVKTDAKKGAAKKATKSAKVEKPAKAEKTAKKAASPKTARAVKSTEKILPSSTEGKALIEKNLDEDGRDLPFKKNSMLRYLVTQAIQAGGIKLEALEKEIKKAGYDLKYMLPVLKSGESGNSSLRPYPSTHSWTFEEKNGAIKITNMKRVACYAKMARIDGR